MPVFSVPRLVLFDIDGTLLRRTGPHHRHALEHALHAVEGVRVSTDDIPTHGMLDTGILELMYRKARLPVARARQAMPRLIREAEACYLRQGPATLQRKTCPGARRALQRMAALGIPLLLVTGNFPRIGWRKLELAGLDGHFQGGAFAGMSSTRAGLARLAMADAKRRGLFPKGSPTRDIWLIGDSPNDVAAAHANRITAVAVSTGITTHQELGALQPEILLRSLDELRFPRQRTQVAG